MVVERLHHQDTALGFEFGHLSVIINLEFLIFGWQFHGTGGAVVHGEASMGSLTVSTSSYALHNINFDFLKL